MKNIKNNLFYAIIIFSVLRCPISYSGGILSTSGNTQAAKALGESLADGLLEIDPTLGTQAAGTIGDKIKEGMKHLGSDAVEKVRPPLDNAALAIGVGVAIYGTATVVDMGSRLYDYKYPDEEKKSRLNSAREVNEYIDARRDFRTCLKNNIKSQTNSSGIPTACEQAANMFAIVPGSRAELHELKEIFKSLYRE